MTPSALLDRARSLGIRLMAVGDRLDVEAPIGTLTPELRADLVAHKPALLALLAEAPAGGAWVDAGPADPDHVASMPPPRLAGMEGWPLAWLEFWYERAAIREMDGGVDRPTAEALASGDLARSGMLDLSDLSPYPWRNVLATLPDAMRESWASRANELAEIDRVAFPLDEYLAFAEVAAEAPRTLAG